MSQHSRSFIALLNSYSIYCIQLANYFTHHSTARTADVLYTSQAMLIKNVKEIV